MKLGTHLSRCRSACGSVAGATGSSPRKQTITPLKADHAERPIITPCWSFEHPSGILTNSVFLDFMISRSGWHRNRGVFICSQHPGTTPVWPSSCSTWRPPDGHGQHTVSSHMSTIQETQIQRSDKNKLPGTMPLTYVLYFLKKRSLGLGLFHSAHHGIHVWSSRTRVSRPRIVACLDLSAPPNSSIQNPRVWLSRIETREICCKRRDRYARESTVTETTVIIL